MTRNDCPVAAFLDRYDNGDREQLAVVLNDRTRNVELIVRGFHEYNPGFNGAELRKHQQHTCPCFGWVD